MNQKFFNWPRSIISGTPCGGCRAWLKAMDSRSILVGVQGFESLPPHLFFLKKKENAPEKKEVHEKRNSQN